MEPNLGSMSLAPFGYPMEEYDVDDDLKPSERPYFFCYHLF